MTAGKTANVNARIDLNIKTQAEAILSRRGLPVTSGDRCVLPPGHHAWRYSVFNDNPRIEASGL